MAGIAHPAKKFYLCGTVFALLALVFCVTASIIPAYSRIPGLFIIDVAADLPMVTNDPAFPITSQSKLYYGHWQWCLFYNDDNNTYTCGNANAREGAPAFGDPKCRGFLNASRILGLIAIGFTFFGLLAAAFALSKVMAWTPYSVWKKPTGPAAGAFLIMLLALGLLLATWLCWIVLAEHACRSPVMNFNPFQGYSTSFILECFASGFALFSVLGLCLGLTSLGKVPNTPAAPMQPKEEVVYVEAPAYPTTTPYMAPVTYPVDTYGQPAMVY